MLESNSLLVCFLGLQLLLNLYHCLTWFNRNVENHEIGVILTRGLLCFVKIPIYSFDCVNGNSRLSVMSDFL